MNPSSGDQKTINGINTAWWKEAVIYQIYPRSFCDSDGDGVGDLQGIISKLDYLAELGVDVIWLSPVYQSPNDDNGYDISDYYQIMEEFGSMADFDTLMQESKRRDIKIIMDLVVNHTSDEHHWFQEAQKSKDNLYRDYYIWKAPRQSTQGDSSASQPPNNWESIFSGSAWEYHSNTNEYYLHLFSKKQPDLNWENKAVREEVYKLMRFWLDKGIGGFRMDVIPFMSKREGFADIDYENFPDGLAEAYANGPKIHEYLQEMREQVMQHYPAFSVGEGPGISPEVAPLYVDEKRKELDMIFHFDHLQLDRENKDLWQKKDYRLQEFKEIFERWDESVGRKGWGAIYLGNHDTARIVSRFGQDGEHREASAKTLATLMFTQRGTVGIYQGDEIGMTNVQLDDISEFLDIQAINLYQERVVENGEDSAPLLAALNRFGRDNARSPFQWDQSEHSGFTSGTPWQTVNPNYISINAQDNVDSPNSIFHHYKQLITLRRAHSTLVYGDCQILDRENDNVYAYLREDERGKYLILLNFSEHSSEFTHKTIADTENAQLLIGTHGNEGELSSNTVRLAAYESRVYLLADKQ